jgi:hypothetical protein
VFLKGTYRNKSYDFEIPADVPRYNASTVRVERTDRYKLVNLINGDRKRSYGSFEPFLFNCDHLTKTGSRQT